MMRWLLAAVLQLLLLVPAGRIGWDVMTQCRCGMDRGHCVCKLSQHAPHGGHCSMQGGMPDHCSLRSPSLPVDGRTSPLGPDFRDRLGVFRYGVPDLDPAPGETLLSWNAVPPAAVPAPPDLPPPRVAFRIG